MLTDDQARDLLNEAALTVDVPQHVPPFDLPPRQRRWVAPLAAAAAIVLVVGVAVAVTRDGGTHADKVANPPNTTHSNADQPDNSYVFRLGPDQVPNVMGYSAEGAAAMLRALGYQASVDKGAVSACGASRAMGTEPGVGTVVEPGAEIVVLESSSATMDCIWDRGGMLLNMLFGDTVPDLADTVAVSVGGKTVTVSPDDVDDVGVWDPVVAELRNQMAPELVRYRGEFVFVARDPWSGGCYLDGRYLSPDVGACTSSTPEIEVTRNEDGLVNAITILPSAEPVSALPEVVGNSEAYASERLTDAGFAVEVVEYPGCTPEDLVIDMRDSVGPGGTVQIGVAAGGAGGCFLRPRTDGSVPTGAGTVEIPNVVGLRLESAQAVLDNAGLVAEVDESQFEACDAPVVGSQNPAPGKERLPRAAVTLTLTCS